MITNKRKIQEIETTKYMQKNKQQEQQKTKRGK